MKRKQREMNYSKKLRENLEMQIKSRKDMDKHLSQYNKFLPTLRKINQAAIDDGTKIDPHDTGEMSKMKEIFSTFGPKNNSSPGKKNSNSKGRNKAGANYESTMPARRILLNQDTSRESFGNHLRKVKSGERKSTSTNLNSSS